MLFPPRFAGVADPRDPEKVEYPLPSLLFASTLMYLCRLTARREIALKFRTSEQTAAWFQELFGCPGAPHGDTINEAFERLDPEQVQQVQMGLVRTLIRDKVLDQFRLLGRWFVVAIDATGQLTFPERHCPHCLTRTHDGTTLYYHYVLEAKLVCQNGFAFSLGTEFIENPGENPTKQDCELKAFYRLAQRLKAAFPRLPLALTLDGLYACGPVFKICADNDWKYVVVLKEGSLPSVVAEFGRLASLGCDSATYLPPGKAMVSQALRWVDDIDYTASDGTVHRASVLECKETCSGKSGDAPKETRHLWITNIRLGEPKSERAIAVATTVASAVAITVANQGGRGRWKIENEGFNVQKNGGYGLEHAYSHNPIASKVFYLVLQIAHMLAQLLAKGSLLAKVLPAGIGSGKHLAFLLLEAFRNAVCSSSERLEALFAKRVRIQFDSS